MSTSHGSRKIVLRADPDFDPGAALMEFRLTYQGTLRAASSNDPRTTHKHEIRKVFHRQLKRYWRDHPFLSTAPVRRRYEGLVRPEKKLLDHLSEQYEMFGYNFVPLVTESLSLICAIDILFLRPSMPGALMKSGDLDNRLKTVFDALRMPGNKAELGGYDRPEEDEKPFYCLLSDDKLITHVSIETDTLLEPVAEEERDIDARLVITVRLKPFDMGWDNINFS